MSLEGDIISRYAAPFDNRMWWDTTPPGLSAAQRVAPMIVLQLIGGPRRQYVDDKEVPEFLNARVQVEVWAKQRVAAAEALRQFEDLALASNTADWAVRVAGEPMSDFDPVLDVRGVRQDFMFTYRNPSFQG